MIQILFRTQDSNIKTGTIQNPRQNSQLIHNPLCFQNPRIRSIYRKNPICVLFKDQIRRSKNLFTPLNQLEDCQKYSATCHIFNSLLSVWICCKTQSFMFDKLLQRLLCLLPYTVYIMHFSSEHSSAFSQVVLPYSDNRRGACLGWS